MPCDWGETLGGHWGLPDCSYDALEPPANAGCCDVRPG